MANEQNLKVLTPNEARELGQKGGIISGQVRRERKKIKEMALTIANNPMQFTYSSDKDRFTKQYGIDNPTILDGIVIALLKKASYGDLKAMKLLFSIIEDHGYQTPNLGPGTVTEQEVKVSYKAKKQTIE